MTWSQHAFASFSSVGKALWHQWIKPEGEGDGTSAECVDFEALKSGLERVRLRGNEVWKAYFIYN